MSFWSGPIRRSIPPTPGRHTSTTASTLSGSRMEKFRSTGIATRRMRHSRDAARVAASKEKSYDVIQNETDWRPGRDRCVWRNDRIRAGKARSQVHRSGKEEHRNLQKRNEGHAA